MADKKRDYYDVLEISRECKQDEIKAAYRKAAFKYHPDRNQGNAEAEEKFKEVAEAYEVLSDPNKRAKYDRFGHDGLKGESFQYQSADIFDIFGNLFNGSMFDDFFQGGQRGRRGAQQGATRKVELQLTMEECATGAKKEITFRRMDKCTECDGTGSADGSGWTNCHVCRGTGSVTTNHGFISMRTPCPKCGGQGKTLQNPCKKCSGRGKEDVEKTVTATIPAGIDDGSRMRLHGEGDAGDPGASRGDLLVYITVAPHPIFMRRDQDIYCEVAIKFHRAALGGTIRVPTLHGEAELKVPHGIQPGQLLRMRGMGMPHYQNPTRRGDQYVSITIEVPKSIDSKKKELLEQLAKLEGEEIKPRSKGIFERLKDILFTGE